MKILLLSFFMTFSAYATTMKAPCRPYLYIMAYKLQMDSLPQGLVVMENKAKYVENTADDDYLYYGEESPIMLVEQHDFLKLEKGRLYKFPKNRFKGLKGKPGNPLNEPWPDRPNPEQELRLNQLVHVKHPWPNGSDKKIQHLPEHEFAIKGLLNPRWANGEVAGTPFKIYGKLFFREAQQDCGKTPLAQ